MEVREADRGRLKSDKGEAVAAVWEMVSILEAERRNPDAWERTCLMRALSDLFSGRYGLALCEARLARTPAKQRSPTAALSTDPVTARLDVALIRKVMTHVDAEPLRYPHFGPVVLT
ncbi:MAG TPA: hypothetical protein VH414_00725 [Lichenihabitans sp.]|nr:hypothetical protein [Lichenihabitans sp.]